MRGVGIAAESTAANSVEDVADETNETRDLRDVDYDSVVAAGRTGWRRSRRRVAVGTLNYVDRVVSGSSHGDGGHGKSEDCGELHIERWRGVQ